MTKSVEFKNMEDSNIKRTISDIVASLLQAP